MVLDKWKKKRISHLAAVNIKTKKKIVSMEVTKESVHDGKRY